MVTLPGSQLLLAAVGLLAAAAGAFLGWVLRGERFRRERLRIGAAWQEKVEAEQLIAERLRRQSRSLSNRLDEVRRSERDARKRLADLEGEIVAVVATREQVEADLVDSEIALASSNRKRDELHRQLQHLLTRSRELLAASRAKDEKIFTLSRQLSSWQQRLPPLVHRFREKEKEATAVNEALDIERARARELEDTLKTRIMPLMEGAPDNGGGRVDGDGDARLEECRALCRQLREELAAAQASIESLRQEAEGDGRVGLQRIKGVGPVLERQLNEMGIYRLEQIASFSPDDVRRVQAELKDFPDRIERDDWVGQARNLTRGHAQELRNPMTDERSER